MTDVFSVLDILAQAPLESFVADTNHSIDRSAEVSRTRLFSEGGGGHQQQRNADYSIGRTFHSSSSEGDESNDESKASILLGSSMALPSVMLQESVEQPEEDGVVRQKYSSSSPAYSYTQLDTDALCDGASPTASERTAAFRAGGYMDGLFSSVECEDLEVTHEQDDGHHCMRGHVDVSNSSSRALSRSSSRASTDSKQTYWQLFYGGGASSSGPGGTDACDVSTPMSPRVSPYFMPSDVPPLLHPQHCQDRQYHHQVLNFNPFAEDGSRPYSARGTSSTSGVRPNFFLERLRRASGGRRGVDAVNAFLPANSLSPTDCGITVARSSSVDSGGRGMAGLSPVLSSTERVMPKTTSAGNPTAASASRRLSGCNDTCAGGVVRVFRGSFGTNVSLDSDPEEMMVPGRAASASPQLYGSGNNCLTGRHSTSRSALCGTMRMPIPTMHGINSVCSTQPFKLTRASSNHLVDTMGGVTAEDSFGTRTLSGAAGLGGAADVSSASGAGVGVWRLLSFKTQDDGPVIPKRKKESKKKNSKKNGKKKSGDKKSSKKDKSAPVESSAKNGKVDDAVASGVASAQPGTAMLPPTAGVVTVPMLRSSTTSPLGAQPATPSPVELADTHQHTSLFQQAPQTPPRPTSITTHLKQRPPQPRSQALFPSHICSAQDSNQVARQKNSAVLLATAAATNGASSGATASGAGNGSRNTAVATTVMPDGNTNTRQQSFNHGMIPISATNSDSNYSNNKGYVDILQKANGKQPREVWTKNNVLAPVVSNSATVRRTTVRPCPPTGMKHGTTPATAHPKPQAPQRSRSYGLPSVGSGARQRPARSASQNHSATSKSTKSQLPYLK